MNAQTPRQGSRLRSRRRQRNRERRQLTLLVYLCNNAYVLGVVAQIKFLVSLALTIGANSMFFYISAYRGG